ncbi:hypothetical protein LEP1GSC021_0723 [Leptospira noguchii str. 1993005606]|uniref:Uncharacterized protein n=2 Tax=Leptospira noguchii TaxID=28182 RepID=M6Y8J9_9LEPT|nr:hypothetical protein LEP1GSC035_0872 [Leptospira noguchii str. 2007001578]EMO90060.1 hypothetical protein LEP1GSC024_2912 [Leptospira noguchii str. 2001034031]EPE82821.1 hypothetical protein LEP1GSC021_0723 [Leptospira noguchii str. 1993005606]
MIQKEKNLSYTLCLFIKFLQKKIMIFKLKERNSKRKRVFRVF